MFANNVYEQQEWEKVSVEILLSQCLLEKGARHAVCVKRNFPNKLSW